MRLASTATLAVIDLQHVFADPASGWYAPGCAELVGPIGELVAAFEPRVAFTRFIAPVRPSGAWRAYYDDWPFALVPPQAPQYRLLAPFQDRPAVTASTFGKWSELAGSGLLDPEVPELVLAGVSTDCCVLSTALAAADAGARVLVASDGCVGSDGANHEQALAAMRLYAPLIDVVTVAELLSARAEADG